MTPPDNPSSDNALPSPPAVPSVPGRSRVHWLTPILLFLLVLALYLSNRRAIGQYDTEPATLLLVTLYRGEGLYLDRFAPVLFESDGRRSPYVAASQGHIVSRYPVAPALVAFPLAAPLLLYFDATRPGWDAHPYSAWAHARLAGKLSASILTALAMLVLARVLSRLEIPTVPLILASLAAALGSDLWTIASQALWQHGPSALFLTLTILLLLPDRPGAIRLTLAGFSLGLLLACRLSNALLVAVVIAWVARNHSRLLPAALLPLSACAFAVIAYNLYLFGTFSGGQAALELMHPELHGTPAGVLSGDFLGGLMGTLFSPARGLFIYSPWTAIGLLMLPRTWRQLPGNSLIKWLVPGLALYLLMFAKYPVWWAGHTFGPRYWTDVIPILAILLALALNTFRKHLRALGLVAVLLILWSISVQALGAFYYPSSWNLSPTNIDKDHARLWDWRDNELSRCLIEGPK